VILLLLFVPVGVYHRIRSQTTGERLDRRQEGLFILVSLRLAGLLFLLGFLAWLIESSWLAWSSVPLPDWPRWLGVGLVATGLLLVAWTFHHLGRNLTDTVVTRRQHSLVTTGPYRWVRHPFYVAAALCFAGVSLAVASWLLALAGGLILVLLVLRTDREEELLVERFGDAYRRYAERTGRFLPRWRA
jgi:protein-S-isoprenylcysteine O-methyltransferase Ste14